MNTRDLAYFAQLVELRNFTQVAAHFGVTQPTITLALKRLEDEFDARLIHRDTSHTRLTVTTAGRQLYQHAQAITRELALAHTEIDHLREEKIRFGLPPIIGNYYFPKIAAKLVTVGLTEQLMTQGGGSGTLLTMVQNGSLDIALLGHSGPLSAPGLTVTQLAQAPFRIVVPAGHPLAQQKSLAFTALADQPFVVLDEGYVHARAFRWFTQTAGVRPNIVYRSNDVGVVKQMIKQGVGIGFLTQIAITAADGLVAIPIAQTDQPRFTISVVHRTEQVMTPLLTTFADLLTHSQK
ncbi:LysR family transcriptional regulator [Schleiferilactobacillus perolens]|uniref:Malolactic fermentation system transcription activator n=1 Tax=Schleiferilactobacillus perolens DSM 12744 TaxID=1423792 RepID=A0A0R1MPW3_9LACO|nr:LysR family transcriptional regulator [Schleiferilactobacillus perolens]KRL10022.1 malolactic fermentation system transcription activator [Schleiferilactobacillus perolens DSM 12744]